MPTAQAEFEDEGEFEEVQSTKHEHGLTWRGMLMVAKQSLDQKSKE